MNICSEQEAPLVTITHLPSPLQQTLHPLTQLINLQTVPINALKPLISQGLPQQCPFLRELIWKLILGYLPQERRRWLSEAKKQEELYNSFLDQFLSEEKYQDAPLTISRSHQKWDLYEKDYNIWEQVEKDTSRTHAQLAFFSQPTQNLVAPFFTATRKQKYKLISGDESLKNLSPAERKRSYNYDHMTRILYIFAKLNPKAVYVQGMNQILAPIFYLVNAHNPKKPIQEAACFFMFNNVMSDIVDIHITDFGNKAQNPIHSRIRNISTMLLALQPKTWLKLDGLKIDPFFYSFRWITLLFSQEFEMHETLKIWESIFSHNDRSSHTNFIALSLLITSASTINEGDYSEIMHHLKYIGQRSQVDNVIELAHLLHKEHRETDFCTVANQNRLRLEEKEGKRKKLFRFVKQLF